MCFIIKIICWNRHRRVAMLSPYVSGSPPPRPRSAATAVQYSKQPTSGNDPSPSSECVFPPTYPNYSLPSPPHESHQKWWRLRTTYIGITSGFLEESRSSLLWCAPDVLRHPLYWDSYLHHPLGSLAWRFCIITRWFFLFA